MPQPRLSVLLPVHNAEPFLERCLTSLWRQTLVDLEVVAVDDGSTDRSPQALSEHQQQDRRLRVIRQPHRGVVAALNRGLDECRSPIVARMDADDVAHPRRLQAQLETLEARPDIGVVSCLVRIFPASRIAGGYREYERWINNLGRHDEMARERFVESPVAHPSVAMRRHLLAQAGGYRDCGWPEDYDLWLRLFESGVRFTKVPQILHFWMDRPGRLSRIDNRYDKDAFLRCKAHYLACGPLAGRERLVVWGAGRTGRRLMRFLRDEGVTAAAVVDIDPAKIGRTISGAPVIDPRGLPPILEQGTVVVAAVASRGARELIRERLLSFGLAEGRSFWCAA